MIETVEGIVVTEKDYSETSKILDVFTREHGIISIIAKGCKRKNSTLSSLGLLTYANFTIYYKEDKISTLKSFDNINIFKNIRKDYDLINYASFIIKISLQVNKQDFDNDIYNILIDTLVKMDEQYEPIVLIDILLVKYLYFLGVPIQEKCIMCGTTNNIKTISSDKGGYICCNCYTNEPIVQVNTIKYIRMFNYINIKNISVINIDSNIKHEIHSFLINYYDKYTGIYLNRKLLGEYE